MSLPYGFDKKRLICQILQFTKLRLMNQILNPLRHLRYSYLTSHTLIQSRAKRLIDHPQASTYTQYVDIAYKYHGCVSMPWSLQGAWIHRHQRRGNCSDQPPINIELNHWCPPKQINFIRNQRKKVKALMASQSWYRYAAYELDCRVHALHRRLARWVEQYHPVLEC